MLLTNPDKFPSWKAIFYDKLQVCLALWYTGCPWSSSFFLHVFCSPGCFTSALCLHLSLVLATPADTCSRSLGLWKTQTGCSPHTVLSTCLAWRTVVRTLGVAQKSVFRLRAQGDFAEDTDIMYLAAGRMESPSLLSAFYQQIRTKGSKQKQWPVFHWKTQVSEHRCIRLIELTGSRRWHISGLCLCAVPWFTQFL